MFDLLQNSYSEKKEFINLPVKQLNVNSNVFFIHTIKQVHKIYIVCLYLEVGKEFYVTYTFV